MNAKKIKLPKINYPRSNFSFIEEYINIPFKIKRVYGIYDVPRVKIRGSNDYKTLEEYIVSL